MSNIIMCMNEDCPLKKKCYRATAEPSENQAWAEYCSFELPTRDVGCEHYWPNEEEA